MKKQLVIVFSLIIISLTLSCLSLFLPLYLYTKDLIIHSQNWQQTFFQNDNKENLAPIILQDLKSLTKQLNYLKTVHQIFGGDSQAQLAIQQLYDHLTQLQTLLDYFFSDQKSILAVLQNSQEIRATGGFMGSYARIDLENGQLKNLVFNDIYEADGHFNAYQTPPPGIKEYLANGQSWRLPDSNWSPDFPTSSQKILQFFADCNEKNVHNLLAVNLNLMEELLKITGPIYLPDYQINVTAENFAQVARSERSEFFPGTQQKKFFFTLFFNQLKFKLAKLNKDQQLAVINLIIKQIENKNLQFYSSNSQIQEILSKYQLTGAMTQISEANYLFLVESNVGINKANAKIERNVQLKLNGQQLDVIINFSNQNTVPPKQMVINRFISKADNLSYVNYFRVILPADAFLNQAMIDQQIVTDLDENLITNSQGQLFKQYGFLVVVSEQTKNSVNLKITYPEIKTQLFIQKQAGLPATDYQLQTPWQQLEFSLTKDKLIQLQ